MLKTVLAAALAVLCLASSAEARHRRPHIVVADPNCNILWPCQDVISSPRGEIIARKVGIGAAQKVYRGSGVIGGRPRGCPHAYCGCSASLKIFGRIIPKLNLASNWRIFPSAKPAPGMVAWKNHHVFVILSVNSDGTVVAHDGNSGGQLTRVHTVSLHGYHVVNPRGASL